MSLSISPVSHMAVSNRNNISFGMAKFTSEGMRYARSHGDVYEPFSDPTRFQNPAFFDKTSIFKKAPFAKYMENAIVFKKEVYDEDIENVAQTIIECGSTDNAFSNARFIRQMLTTKIHLDKMHPYVRKHIREAAQSVLATNWNNPVLSVNETKALARYAYDERTDDGKRMIASLDGVLDNCDVYGPQK